MKENKKEIVDLFCGCGGLSRGFEMAGFKVVAAIDMWSDAIAPYNHNSSSHQAICEDIHRWTNDYLSGLKEKHHIVGVVGGPPCQGYSTVGTRDVNDPRNHLYLEYCRIVEQLDPDFFVIENVKGLTTLGKGAFKEDILRRFSALGYDVKYQILNAADYGVPQNRYRVFFIGTKNRRFSFEDVEKVQHTISAKDAISDLPELVSDEQVEHYDRPPETAYESMMRGKGTHLFNHAGTRHSEQTRRIINMIGDGGKIRDLPASYWQVRKYNKAFERMASDRPSNTVDTGHRNYFHYEQNRIPSVRENARLQSFPDSFEFLGSKTSQYKQVGNAVPPLLAYAVAKGIMKSL